MKRMSNKLHARSIPAISFILLIATLMSCLLAFPASAAQYSNPTSKSMYYETNGQRVNLGEAANVFTVNTGSLSMRWDVETRAYSASSVKSGSAQVAVWYLANSGYYTLFDETSSSQGYIEGTNKVYSTNGSGSYSDPSIFPLIVGYGVKGTVNYMHSLKATNGNNTNGDHYFTFVMSTRTSKPVFTNP